MSGRTARDAMSAYRERLQLVVSCVTNAVVQGKSESRSGRVDETRAFALNNGVPVPVSGETPLLLRVQQHCMLNQDVEVPSRQWTISLVGYVYTIQLRNLTEVVAYQWHPQRTIDLPFPHVHFGPASSRSDSAVRPGELHKVHFPTGIVSVEDIIRLAIDEFHVEPRRSDWEAVLGHRSREPRHQR